MRLFHPAFMAALYLVGLFAAARGGPARMVKLRAGREPAVARAHRLPAAVFAALVVGGAAGGLLATYSLLPLLFGWGVHFQVGMILLGLLVLVALNAWLARRGMRWALHLHPLLAVIFLLLYLAQAMLGLQILGYAPTPAAPQSASAGQLTALARLDMEPPGVPWPPPDESARLEPHYAICPESLALPAPNWVTTT